MTKGVDYLRGIGLVTILALALALVTAPTRLLAQYQPPSQFLNISGTSASTWTTGGSNIVQLEGPVTIQIERATMTAQDAVIWLEDDPNEQSGQQIATIALLDNAVLQQTGIKRSGEELLVSAKINGPIKINAKTQTPQNLATTPIFHRGEVLRLSSESEGDVIDAATTQPARPATRPSTRPTTRRTPLSIRSAETRTTSVQGNLGWISGPIAITVQRPGGDTIELQADRAVLFSKLPSLREAGAFGGARTPEEFADAVYLEGDVRVVVSPSVAGKGEQRLQAERVYFDFETDRAVLTEAVIHTVDPQRAIPIVVRAEKVRQLSQGEFRAEKAQVTTSGFAVPSYSIRAEKAYVLEEPTGDTRYGNRTTFTANHVTFGMYGVPVFYLPAVAGVMTEHGFPLRGIQVGQSSEFGWYEKSEWGLFETIGKLPPQGVDASFRLDYFSERGFAGGVDGSYGGGFVSETSKQPYTFEGDFKSYFVPHDTGEDDLGRKRALVDPTNDFRGRAMWEHQSFFPEDWQLQIRAGWTSDATFREAWFEDEFNDALPMETSLYLKKQHDTEAITFLASVQPNNVVTAADLIQEQFEVERLPQLGYHRIGDSFAKDTMTFFSDNTVERVRFNVSGTNVGQQGFRYGRGVKPGQPSLGIVGDTGAAGPPNVPEDWTDRVDLRQEVDRPFAAGHFKVVPYVVGRYTGYSDSPDSGRVDRGFAGAGVKVNTQIWQVNNDVESDFWDIHRTRHIIEPEVHVWTSVENASPDQVWIYDESVDEVYDVSAMQVALRQRWQTKRGGPGNYRNVEFLSLNVAANFYANQPSAQDLTPAEFRGLFFPSAPDISIPRSSINADASWRLSDTTVLLSDVQYNMDNQQLATASIGVVAERGDRTKYFLSFRDIAALESRIVTLAATYQLSSKYSVGGRVAYDFGDNSDVYTSVSLQRKFDRFFTMFTVYNDANTGESGFSFGLYPEGFGGGASSDSLGRVFGSGGQ